MTNIESMEYVNLYHDFSNKNNYLLVKNDNAVFSVLMPPELESKNDTYRKKWLMKAYFRDQIDLFYRINKTYAPNINLDFFNKNLSTLKIRFISNAEAQIHDAQEVYYLDKNLLVVTRETNLLPQGLYNLASSINRDERGFSGFSQVNYFNGKVIGREINKGYTSLLTQRYFNITDENSIQRAIMKFIEKIIGRDKMENLYSKANLWGLLGELKNEGFYQQFTRLMNDLDSSFRHLNLDNGLISVDELRSANSSYTNEIKSVYLLIIDIIKKHIANLVEKGVITTPQANELLKAEIDEQNNAFKNSQFADDSDIIFLIEGYEQQTTHFNK